MGNKPIVQKKQTIKRIKLSDIFIPLEGDNLQVWTEDMPEVQSIIISIKATKLNSMLIVSESNPEETKLPYTIQDGSKRKCALEAMGVTEINVVVEEAIDSTQRLMIQMGTNAQASGMITANYIAAAIRLQREKGWSIKDIATHCGMSEKQIDVWYKTLRLPQAAKDAMNEGKLTLVNAKTLAQLVNKVDDEEFDHFLAEAQRAKQPEFGPLVDERVKAWKDERKSILDETKGVFQVPVAKILSKVQNQDLLDLLTTTGTEFEREPTSKLEVELNLLKRIFGVDEVSIAKAKSDWQKDEEAKDEAKKNSKAKKGEAKLTDMVKALEAQGHKVELATAD